MTPAIEEARRYLQLADDDAAAFRALLKLPEVKFRLYDDTDIPLISGDEVETIVDAPLGGRGGEVSRKS